MPATALPKKMKTEKQSVDISERRVWVRYNCDMSIKCRGTGEDSGSPRRRAHSRAGYQDLAKRFSAKISNISRGGMRVEATCPFEKNSKFNIELDRGSRQKPLGLTAYVKQIIQIDSGHWSIGCAFTELLDEDDLETLLLFGPGSRGFASSILMRGFRAIGRAVASLLAFVGLG